jgi:hypothetical protein
MSEKIFSFLIMSMVVLTISCGSGNTGSNGNTANKANANTTAKPDAIVIAPEALAKEWIANSPGTDEKYKGKTLSVTGEVSFVAVIGNEAFINMDGVKSTVKDRGAKISCAAPVNEDTKRLVYLTQEAQKMVERETNRTDIKVPNPKVTVKGVYLSSTPPDRLDGTIDLKPCEVEPLFK